MFSLVNQHELISAKTPKLDQVWRNTLHNPNHQIGQQYVAMESYQFWSLHLAHHSHQEGCNPSFFLTNMTGLDQGDFNCWITCIYYILFSCLATSSLATNDIVIDVYFIIISTQSIKYANNQ